MLSVGYGEIKLHEMCCLRNIIACLGPSGTSSRRRVRRVAEDRSGLDPYALGALAPMLDLRRRPRVALLLYPCYLTNLVVGVVRASLAAAKPARRPAHVDLATMDVVAAALRATVAVALAALVAASVAA